MFFVVDQYFLNQSKAMIGPVDNYALTRTIPYTSYFSMLHITPGGMSANLRRVSKLSVYIDDGFVGDIFRTTYFKYDICGILVCQH